MKYVYITIIAILVSSCQDAFDLTPSAVIQEEFVYQDENLANAYLAELYAEANFTFTGGMSFDHRVNTINSMGGEARNFAPWQPAFGQVIGPVFNENGAGIMTYWPYEYIRQCNEFIEQLPQSEFFDEEFKVVRAAEARFLRAFAYFEMVIRYGGVPIVTQALPLDAPEEELFVARNSEKEVYDFIASEMDDIVQVLPNVADLEGRVTRWAALALKSRAMLYAASVAQFGTVQLDGLLGFPASDANGYYQASLEASQEILESGPFSLYRKQTDLVQNFADLFTDDANNPEVILVEKYDATAGLGHNWDLYAHPDGFGFGWNSNFPVYVETFENFDFVDGTSGKLDRSVYDGQTPIDPARFFGERDPRMLASISYPGMPWRGARAYYHRSTTYTDENGDRQTSTNESFIIPGSDGWPGAGPPRNRNAAVTSLQVRKRLDESLPQTGGGLSNTDFYEFRLAEIMLNYIEAAFYLGDPNGDMARYLNDEIRDRAGMPPVTEITEERIRQERRVELAFEDHVFWDLRRWRIAVEELDQKMRHRFHFDYDFDTGTYTVEIADGDRGRVRSHPERNYYYALGLGRIADNPNLVENPGY
ncbi:MAG: RagB/SusD family nutrient uptake outer membrane protein [Bacteroidota bacterium]